MEKVQEENADEPFSQKSVVAKSLYTIEYPLALVIEVLIPPVDQERLKTPWILIYPITAPFSIIFIKGCKPNNQHLGTDQNLFGVQSLILCGIFSLVLFTAVLFLQRRRSYLSISWIFTPICILSSIIWLSFTAGMILDIIEVSQHPLTQNITVLLGHPRVQQDPPLLHIPRSREQPGRSFHKRGPSFARLRRDGPNRDHLWSIIQLNFRAGDQHGGRVIQVRNQFLNRY